MVELHERVLNTVLLKFNHPDRPSQSTECEVVSSKNATLAELKVKIAEVLGLEAQSLHLRRSRKSPQLKDETKTLRQVGVTDADFLYVGHGAPCGSDECLLQIALYSREKGVSRATELFEHAVHHTCTVRSLREALLEPLKKWGAEEAATDVPGWTVNSFTWQQLRLRDGQASRQFAVLRDDRTIRSALPGLSDGRQVAVQILEKEETLGPDVLIIAVRPWRVKEGRLHASSELLVNKTQTLAEFRSMFSERFAGLLQSGCASSAEEAVEDYLEIVALPSTSGGPPLTSQRCPSLKWTESPLNTTSEEALAKPLSELRDLRDGVTLVLRSRLAAAAATAAATSEGTEGSQEAPSTDGAKSVLRPAAAGKAGARRPVAVTVAAPVRRERSLRIEVVCPDTADGGGEVATSEAAAKRTDCMDE